MKPFDLKDMLARLGSGLVGRLRGRPPVPFSVLYKKFKGILERHNTILELIGDMGDKLGGDYVFDRQYIFDSCERLGDQVFKLISDLNLLCQGKNVALFAAFERIQQRVRAELAGRRVLSRTDHILPISELTHDLADEGGNKMASLGDIRNILGFPTPQGFVITAGAYFEAMLDARSERPVGNPNYALIARDYLNLNARVDYHFVLVDCVCGANPRENAVRFRFKGGGTTRVQRERRARCVEEVLRREEFFTSRQGDMVTATLAEGPREAILAKVEMLGRFIGFSRLLDAVMVSEAMPHRVAEAFLTGDYGLDRLSVDVSGGAADE